MIAYTFTPKDNLEDALSELYHIVSLLRTPEGCPWDRQQSPKDIAGDLQNETWEYLDALHEEDISHESEEIGDVLINVLRLLEVHAEKPDFDIVKAVNDASAKLVRRHPHVFGESQARTPDEVLSQWDRIKEKVEHREPKEDFFSNVPESAPPLERAKAVSRKAAKVGFDWPDKQGVIDKICEELDEVIEADTALDRVQDEVEMEFGDLFFAVVNYARFCGVNPAVALHRANEKFERRFNTVAKLARERNIPLDKDHVKEMNDLWDEVKSKEKKAPGHTPPTTF